MSRKVVHLEPVKPIVLDLENSVTVIESVEKRPLTPIFEEAKEEPKEEVKEEVKEETKEDTKDIVDFPPVNLKIIIPEQSDVVPEAPSGPVARIPEYQGNASEESQAVKKYNRRHRKRNN